MPRPDLKPYIIQTLLYYEIFDYPLTAAEIFYLFPRNSLSRIALTEELESMVKEGVLTWSTGYFHLSGLRELGPIRLQRTRLAHRRLLIARFMAHIIKRFPFVRAVFISGDLSKGVANPKSDIDYVIVTELHRLWICRTLLVLFKKIFLLNSRKYFCLNYYIDRNHLRLDEHNYFTATEVAHLKPLYNQALYLRYMNANSWIKEYFPNYKRSALSPKEGNNRPSFLQKLLELPLQGTWADRLDHWLMKTMQRVWEKRYPQYDSLTRERIFRCSEHESRAYVGNFSDKVLSLYQEKLNEHSVGDIPFPQSSSS